jgi:DNA-binding response OmpR family regulator
MKKRKKILIADDDMHVHEMLKAVLPSDEYEIIDSYDGQETVERIGADRPDLVVLDVMMPIKDGRDICQSLKKDPQTKDIKILMLSARDQQYDRTTGLEVGADDYVTKPFFPSHLASKIKRMCDKE